MLHSQKMQNLTFIVLKEITAEQDLNTLILKRKHAAYYILLMFFFISV